MKRLRAPITTDTAPREPLHQQAFNQCPYVIRDEIWLKAFDALAITVVAWMMLFAVVEGAIFLVLGRLTPWTRISDAHRLLCTSAGVRSVFGQP
jgi:hypothetical protein